MAELPARLRRLTIVLWAASVSACSPDEDGVPTTDFPLPDGVDQVLIDMETPVTRGGVRRAHLEADTAEYRSENEIHMRPVRLVFYDKNGVELTEVTADRGILYEGSQDMEAHGSVVVLDRVEHRRLETEQIRYVNEEDLLYGDRPFTFVSDGGTTISRGDAFESDPSLNRVVVRRPQGESRGVALEPPGAGGPVERQPADSTDRIPR